MAYINVEHKTIDILMPILKAKKGDETVEFEFDEIVEPPEGFLPASQVEEEYVTKSFMEEEQNRRISSVKENMRKKLKEDDEFLQNVAQTKWGLKFEDGKPKASSDVDIDEIRENVKNSIYQDEVEPLRQKLNSLKGSQLSSEALREANKAGIKKEKLEPVYQGKSLLELKASDDLAFDDETEMWAVRKQSGEGFEYAPNPEGNKPYKGVSEWINSLPEDWFTDNIQGGSGYKGGRGKAGPTKKKRRSEMSDEEKIAFIKDNGRADYEKLPY